MYVCMYIHHHRGIIPPPIPWGGGGGGGNTGHGTIYIYIFIYIIVLNATHGRAFTLNRFNTNRGF